MLHIHIRHQHTDNQHGNRAHGISGHGECRPNDCGQPDLKCKQKQTYDNRQNVHIAYQIPQGDLFLPLMRIRAWVHTRMVCTIE